MRYLIITLLTLLCLPTFGIAAPSITASSGITHGQSVTITGASFGTKASGNAAPLRYDDFETGTTVGNDIKTDLPYWSHLDNWNPVAETGQHPTIANDNCIYGKCGKFVITTYANTGVAKRNDVITHSGVGFESTGKMYLNMWQYSDFVGNTNGSDDSYQIKWLHGYRTNPTNNVDVLPNLQFVHWGYQYPSLAGWFERTNLSDYLDGGGSVALVADNDIFKTTGWYNISVEFNFGTVGNADGELRFKTSRYNMTAAYYKKELTNTRFIVSAPPDGYSTYPDGIMLGWYQGSWSGDHDFATTYYYDNIYIDNSWARVEIGDNAVYDSCTHREIQIPSAWSDTSITFTANAGSFAAGAQVYVFVVDESGTPSSGYGPVTLGSSAPVTPPSTSRPAGRATGSPFPAVTLTCADCASMLWCSEVTQGVACTPAVTYSAPFKTPGQNRSWYGYCYNGTDAASNTSSTVCVDGKREKRK